MYLDLDARYSAMPRVMPMARPEWSVLIPFFNERDWLAGTIASIAAQSERATLILVDNGSTDGSAEVAVSAAQAHGLDYRLIIERTPGKVAALRAGLAHVNTRWVATCDADTHYPPHYLAAAAAILRQPGCVVAGAYFIDPETDEAGRQAKATAFLVNARILSRQCHAGGAGQAFCSRALRAAGGFDRDTWNYVLEDHEVINRVMRHGSMRYARDMWCVPAPRERDRDSIRWTLAERLMYLATAPWAGDWFFYSFLGPRLAKRRLLSNRIRERRYQHLESPVLVPSHSLR